MKKTGEYISVSLGTVSGNSCIMRRYEMALRSDT